MNERARISAKLIASHLVLPGGLILASIFISRDAFLFLTITQTALAILFLAGYWEFFGSRFRIAFCATAELVLLSVAAGKFFSGRGQGANILLVLPLSMVQAYLLFALVKIIVVIHMKERPALDLEFPFKRGTYLVTDGGNSRISRLMNYHYYSPLHKKNKTNRSMLHATDIVKIERGKSRFLPRSNGEYPVFGEKVYSPLAGIVVKVVDGLADNIPFSGHYPYNTGNTVVVRKGGHYLLLGHLRKDSILVKEGDTVRVLDPIGEAGNSGWTERPHLHMQLIQSASADYWLGEGVCMRHQDRNLYKNRMINK
jgi:hypothetical protein